MSQVWRDSSFSGDRMECYFCGEEGSPVYWGNRLKIGMCDKHYEIYKQFAPTGYRESEFSLHLTKAFLRIFEEGGRSKNE